jgi:alkanesulfonate monooxygenase SsuD/methylene tetrahydromethanopterin reductase-like flavin-dependent oxidoreductase (luciferase family)
MLGPVAAPCAGPDPVYGARMGLDFGIDLGMNQVGDRSADRLGYYRQCLQAGEGAFSAMWVSDHLQKGDAPVYEGWTTLTYLAALAPSYRAGHLVLSQSYRNPALLAKMAATLQALSGGRLVLGLGAGWQEDEYLSYGFPYPPAGTRIEQLGEAVDVVRAMWTQAPATYEGKHYQVRDAYCEPRPDPCPRILIGGQGAKVMRLVAEKADAWQWDGPLSLYQPPYDRLVRSCADLGRDLGEITLVAGFEAYFPHDAADFPEPSWSGYEDFMTTPFGPTPSDAIDEIRRLADLGVTEFTTWFWDLNTLRRFVDEVVPAFAAN